MWSCSLPVSISMLGILRDALRASLFGAPHPHVTGLGLEVHANEWGLTDETAFGLKPLRLLCAW